MTATATKTTIKTTIANALNNYKHIDCYVSCCRVYLEVSSPITVDDMFKLTNEECKALKTAHKRKATGAMKALAEMGYRTIGNRVYVGYDNACGIIYSQASAIASALENLGIFFIVEA